MDWQEPCKFDLSVGADDFYKTPASGHKIKFWFLIGPTSIVLAPPSQVSCKKFKQAAHVKKKEEQESEGVKSCRENDLCFFPFIFIFSLLSEGKKSPSTAACGFWPPEQWFINRTALLLWEEQEENRTN